MYSLILAAALTTGGAEAPAFHGTRSLGCGGGLYLHSAYGYGGGCCGGYGWGSCHGSYYSACYGSCYGNCYGAYSNCYGYGCGSGWGHTIAGGVGCGGYAVYGGTACYGGCFGCAGNSWSTGSTWGAGNYMIQNPATYPANNPLVAPPLATPPVDPGTVVPKVGAKLQIDTPADSKLFVDGQPQDNGGGRRVFATPALDAGQAYYYDVKVEHSGKTETRRVVVRAGATVREAFGTTDAVATNK